MENIYQPISGSMSSQSQELTGPMVLLKKSIASFKANFSLIFGLALVPMIVGVLFSFSSGYNSGLASFVMTVLSWFFVLALLEFLTSGKEPMVLSTGAVSTLYRGGARRIWSFLWIAILSFAVTFGGLILFIIPAIFISIVITFSLPILFTENKKGLAALVRSRQYVKGYWWPVFGRVLLVGVLAGLVGAIIAALATAIFPGSVGMAFSPIVTFLFVAPIQLIYLVSLYKELRVINLKEDEEESNKTRKWFVGLGILGVVGIVVLVVLVAMLLPLILTFLVSNPNINISLPNYTGQPININPADIFGTSTQATSTLP